MYIAIDLGGTKTLVGLLDESGEIKKAVKFPTPKEYSEFLSQLKNTVLGMIDAEPIKAVCMAIPGTIDRENGLIIKLGNLEWPRDIAIRADLSGFIDAPIIIENDANLAGLAEALILRDEYRKCLYVTTSTGIGSAYVVDGKIDQSTQDAEVGHMVFEKDGRFIEWEDLASGAWLVSTYGQRASELEDPEAWKMFSHNLALGLDILINTLTPEVVIIGGGVGAHLEKFHQPLLDSLKEIDSGYVNIPPIVMAQKPEEAVIHGCYQLIKQKV